MSTLSSITIDTPFFPLELIYRIKQKRSSIDTDLTNVIYRDTNKQGKNEIIRYIQVNQNPVFLIE